MKKFKVSIVFLVLSFMISNCNIVQKEKKDDNSTLILLAVSLSGTGGSCNINVLKAGRNTSASANPIILSSQTQAIAYSRVPVVTHSIGVVTFANATQGSVVEFSNIDVADFDGDGTDALPLIYKTAECPILSSSQISTSSEASSIYTRSVSGSTYTYTINQAGNYSFVLYQLIYPAVASTVKKL